VKSAGNSPFTARLTPYAEQQQQQQLRQQVRRMDSFHSESEEYPIPKETDKEKKRDKDKESDQSLNSGPLFTVRKKVEGGSERGLESAIEKSRQMRRPFTAPVAISGSGKSQERGVESMNESVNEGVSESVIQSQLASLRAMVQIHAMKKRSNDSSIASIEDSYSGERMNWDRGTGDRGDRFSVDRKKGLGLGLPRRPATSAGKVLLSPPFTSPPSSSAGGGAASQSVRPEGTRACIQLTILSAERLMPAKKVRQQS
jgi:hypothetical protein